jgi:hypothetical protein
LQDRSSESGGGNGPTAVAGEAADKARELAGQATEAAKEAGGKASERLRAQMDERAGAIGGRGSAGAEDLKSLAQELRAQEKEGPARMAEEAAQRAERLGGYLAEADSSRILRDLEELGRRQPWTVALGALAVGFAAARFLNASSGDRYRRSSGSGAGRPAGAPQIQPGGYTPEGR